MKGDKKLTILALWAQRLHKNNICYHNHSLDYGNGWFYFDNDQPFRDPDLTYEADQLLKEGITGTRHYVGMREILSLTKITR